MPKNNVQKDATTEVTEHVSAEHVLETNQRGLLTEISANGANTIGFRTPPLMPSRTAGSRPYDRSIEQLLEKENQPGPTRQQANRKQRTTETPT